VLNLLTRIFLAATPASNAAGDAASKASAEDAGWLNEFINKLYDPAWNADHRAQIWALILFCLVSTGFGLPTPEDIWLMLAGFTTWHTTGGEFVWYIFLPVLLSCSLANVLGDLVAWYMGYRWGLGVRERFKFVKKAITDKRLARVQGWFDNYGLWAVFFGRLVAGVRLVTFIMAGTMKIKWWKFALVDLSANLASIPMWLTLGVLIAEHGREYADSLSKKLSTGVLIGGFVLLIVVVTFYKIRNARRAAREALAAATEVDLSRQPLETPEQKAPPKDEAEVDLSKPAAEPAGETMP
jgi:membrane protein DedA with SNARE-associated domain